MATYTTKTTNNATRSSAICPRLLSIGSELPEIAYAIMIAGI
jgi:hypothetical protein